MWRRTARKEAHRRGLGVDPQARTDVIREQRRRADLAGPCYNGDHYESKEQEPDVELPGNLAKGEVRDRVRQAIREVGLEVASEDLTRPWGGFFVIAGHSLPDFAQAYFPEPGLVQLREGVLLSPKVLVVAPRQRLSWQFHNRRAELWKILAGPVCVLTSATDAQPDGCPVYRVGEVVTLPLGTRHRLVGLDSWGAVAEIWQHTDPHAPSDEADICRLQDDYGR